MSKILFDFPLGLRLWPEEHAAARFRLKEGYTFSQLEHSFDSYRITSFVGASKTAKLLRSFTPYLPKEVFFILEFYEDNREQNGDKQPVPTIYYSPYLPTRELLKTIEPYLLRLIHDGFVGFGLANNRAGFELFYSEEKVLSCFTGNHIRIMDLLAQHGIAHKTDLVCPTDFGHDHLALSCFSRQVLPEPLASMSDSELDYANFCAEITELLDMYPVEEGLSFFLSEKEQDIIEKRFSEHPEFSSFAKIDFGSLLLDWNDFVEECEESFEGDLWEYRQGLKLRDMIQYVAEGAPETLNCKIQEIVEDADKRFQNILIDQRKRLDPPDDLTLRGDLFWYRGIVRKHGAGLRRGLIRQGWFQPGETP